MPWSNVRLPFLNQSLQKNIFPEVELSILRDSLRLRLLPYLCRRLDKLNALKALSKKIDEIGNMHAKYLKILVQAIQEPTNNDLDKEARVVESQLSKNISYTWKVECVLGLPVSAFSSIEAWKEFKQKISDASINDPRWIAKSIDFNKSHGLWTCLFFHPDHWSLLVEENLITEEEHDNLLNTQLGDILKIPLIPVDIFQGITLLSDAPSRTPIHKVINVVLSILEKEDIERVSKARGLDVFLYHRSRRQPATIEEIEGLLSKANNLPLLPSIWVSVILRLCIDIPEINMELLLNFWENNEDLKPSFYLIHENKLPNGWNQLLERLLGSNRASALRLGMAISACARPNGETENSLRERLLAESSNYLNSDDAFYELYCRALFNMDSTLEEFSLWAQPEIIHRMRKSPWMLNRLSKRFASATDPKSKLDYEQLRKQLSLFIARRCDYPATLALGALEAILKIDETNLPALDAKIWQQCPDK